jgi:hypothetical protein
MAQKQQEVKRDRLPTLQEVCVSLENVSCEEPFLNLVSLSLFLWLSGAQP